MPSQARRSSTRALPRIASLLLATLIALNAHASQTLPARFEANRVYLEAQSATGQRIRLYTATAGGLFIKQAAVERLQLAQHPLPDPAVRRMLGDRARLTRLPAFALEAGIPPPLADHGLMMILPTALSGRTLPDTQQDDGTLGQSWFAGRIWTWDYPAREFRLESPQWRASPQLRRLSLGFKNNDKGQPNNAFAHIPVSIDGKVYSLMLDTGTTTRLTASALAHLNDGAPLERATSLIVDSVFQAWRKAHPDWRVVENAQADTGAAMIQVPEVIIAGYRVGPVWFTHCEDNNFHDFMSGLMDARVDGALGGNALRHFVMTLDYPGGAAYFRCTGTCPSPPIAPVPPR